MCLRLFSLSGCVLDVVHLRLVLDAAGRSRTDDLDLARSLGLGHLMHEIDDQQTVVEVRTRYANMIGKGEAPLEVAAADTAMQEMPFVAICDAVPRT